MSKVFVTSRATKGLEIVAGKYQFFDGMMKVSDSDAELLAPILCRFYGCTIEEASEEELNASKERVDPALVASQTRATESGSQAYVVDSMIAAGKAAGDPNVTGTFSGPAVRIGDEIAQNTAPGGDADPKNVTDQSVEAEATNHANTGGVGTGPLTGATSAQNQANADAAAALGNNSDSNSGDDE
jgi:hypothetical protein